jgi:hypothetical protein
MEKFKCKGRGKGKGRRRYLYPAVIVLVVLIALVSLVTGLMGVASAEYTFLPGSRDLKGSIGKDGKSFRIGFINAICMEGATSNTYETCLYATDPTADNNILFPDSGGTISLTSSYGLVLSGTDGQILVYNALSSSFNAKTMSGDATIANGGAITIATEAVETSMIAPGSDAQILVSTDAAAGSTFWQSVSGDATLTNAGALTVGTNKINTTKLFMNSVVVTVAGGAIYNSNTVSNGSVMTGYAPVLNVNSTAFANQVAISETTAFVCTTATPTYYQQYRIFYVEP